MNEPVRAMIDKLHARLDDLSEVVDSIPFELTGYDKKLDRIDDQVYLLEVELEKKAKGVVPLTPLTAEQSEAFDAAARSEDKSAASSADKGAAENNDQEKAVSSSAADKEETSEGFLTDSAKETIAGATKTLNSLYKDGKEVVGEFSEAFGDIKEVFGINPFKKRR